MSLLMFIQDEEEVLVVTDTLATTQTGDPYLFVTKCWPIPHMNTLIASTGSALLLDKWIEFVRSSIIARDVVNLDLHTPAALNSVWEELKEEHDRLGITGTIYHFGLDPDTGKTVRFTYRTKSGFKSERADETGFGCRPPLEHSTAADHDGDLREIAEAVRAEQRALAPGDQVYIGGDLYLTVLNKSGIVIRHLHRFDDWPFDWNSICERATSERG